ncbi:MAG: hypothetical protein ACJ790_17390 [Myxococcaceae bacterium]
MEVTLRAALALALFLAVSAHAQDVQPRPERLYVDPGILLGSPRVIALGGAYAGIAEGPGGLPSNLAAIAHKSPRLDRNWDVGLGLSWLDVPLGSPRKRDLDNDGRQDAAQDSRQFLVGMQLQYKRFGIGAYFRSGLQRYCGTFDCDPDRTLTVSVSHTALAAALSLGDDEFLIAFGLYAANAYLATPHDEWTYGNTGTSFDFLYRPRHRNYRIGASVKPQVEGPWRQKPGQPAQIDGRQIFGSVVSPASLSIGASWRLGEGARNYNQLSPAGYDAAVAGLESGELPPDKPDPNAPSGSLLISAQVDLIGPVDNAVNLLSFVNGEQPQTVGNTAYVVPRVGAEHETIEGRLRTRLGSYIEPSYFADSTPRPHLTGGAEVFVLHYLDDWAVSASFDVAPRYYNVGLSIGFWK